MNALTDWLLSATLSAGTTLALVLIARHMLAARLDARARYALWLAVPLHWVFMLPGMQSAFPAPVPALLPTLGVSTAASGADSGTLSTAGLVTMLWLVGLGLMLARLGVHLARAHALSKHSRPVARPAAVGPTLPPGVLCTCDRIDTPLVAGLFRPRILVPPGFLDAQPPATVALILEHEDCHLRRRDNLINLGAGLVLALQWFNPLAWIAMRAFRTDQEVSADAEALARSHTPAAGRYARALIDLAGRRASPALTSAWISIPSLKRRITMLDHHRPARRGTLVAGLSLALTVALTGTAFGAGGKRPAADPEIAATEDVVPLVRISPRYPVDAAENRIEGFVTAEFTITEDGKVADIVVMESAPGETFVPEAITALSRWRFKPMTVDGVAVPRRATQTIEFEID